jgi:hypothetical protein
MEKIYLIEDINDLKYVGRTKYKLYQRLGKHIYDKRAGKLCSSSKLNLEYCNISVLEECLTEDAHQRERYYIHKIECVNHIIPPKTENIYYNKKNDRWIYNKMINGKTHHKWFKTEEEAIQYKRIFELNPDNFINVRRATNETKNVSYYKRDKVWRYSKMINGKTHQKYFKTEEEAIQYKRIQEEV